MARKYKKDIKVVLPHIDPFRDIAVYGAGEEMIKAMGGVVHAGIKKPDIVPTSNNPYFKKGIKKFGKGGPKQPLTFEQKVDKALGYPGKKGAQDAELNPWYNPTTKKFEEQDPVDNVRHASAARYTAEAISNKLSDIPFIPKSIANTVGYLGANALGIGHELSLLPKDKRWTDPNIGNVLERARLIGRESLEDIYNNAVGANVGAFSGMSPNAKRNYIRKLSWENKIPDGYGDVDPFKQGLTKRYSNKKAYGGYKKKYAEGGVEEKEVPVNVTNPYLLKEVTITPEQEDTYTNYILNKNKDASLAEAMFLTPIDYIASYPQAAMMKALTGKYGEPSDKIGYKNPEGFLEHAWNFGVNAVADPTNIVGAGLIDDAARLGLKGNIKNFKNNLVDFSNRKTAEAVGAITGDYEKAIDIRDRYLRSLTPSLEEGEKAFRQRKEDKLKFWQTPEGERRLQKSLIDADNYSNNIEDIKTKLKNTNYVSLSEVKNMRDILEPAVARIDHLSKKHTKKTNKSNSIFNKLKNKEEELNNLLKNNPEDKSNYTKKLKNNIDKLTREYKNLNVEISNIIDEWQTKYDEALPLSKQVPKNNAYYSFNSDDVFLGEDYLHPSNLGATLEHELSGHAVDLQMQRPSFPWQDNKQNKTNLTKELLENIDLEKTLPVHLFSKAKGKDFLKSMTRENYNPRSLGIRRNSSNYFDTEKEYYKYGTYDFNNEPPAFLSEIRDYLYKKGDIKTLEEPVSERMIEKAFSDYRNNKLMKNDYRLFDIADPTEKTIKTITEKINDLPSWVIPTIGTSTTGTLLNKIQNQPSSEYANGGVINNIENMKKSNKKGQRPRSILSPEEQMAMQYGWGGGLSGGLSGAATGASIGSIIPGVGTALGAGVGALVGGISGHLNEKKQDAAQLAMQSQYQSQIPQQMQFAKGGMLNKRGIPHRGTSEQMPYQSQMQSYPNLEFGNGEQMLAMGGELEDIEMYKDGGIYIKPSKRGTFTAAAKKRGMGVQEFASKVLANKENYSSAMVKKANFARNAAKWKHEDGGFLQEPEEGVIERRNKNRSREPQEYATFEENFKHMYADGGLIKRADGSYSKRGLWDNIRANAGSGKKPTKEMLKQEAKIKREEKAMGGAMGPMDVNDIYYANGGKKLKRKKDYYDADPLQTSGTIGTEGIGMSNRYNFNDLQNPIIAEFQNTWNPNQERDTEELVSKKDLSLRYSPLAYEDKKGSIRGDIKVGVNFPQGAGQSFQPYASAGIRGTQKGKEMDMETRDSKRELNYNLSYDTNKNINARANLDFYKSKYMDLGAYGEGNYNIGTKDFTPSAGLRANFKLKHAAGGMLNEYNGYRHEDGGIPIGPNAEVEGGETSMKMAMGGEQDSTYIFSDRLKVPGKNYTFAEASKRIDNKYGRRTNDKLSDESKRLELNKLMNTQEQERAVLVNSAYETIAAYGGPIHKYVKGGPKYSMNALGQVGFVNPTTSLNYNTMPTSGFGSGVVGTGFNPGFNYDTTNTSTSSAASKNTSNNYGTGEQWATGIGYGLQGASLLARQLQLSMNKLSPNKAFTMERQVLNAKPQLDEADISAAIANRNIQTLGAGTSSGGAMQGYLAAQAGRTRSKSDILADLQNRQAQVDMNVDQYNAMANERAYDKNAADLAAQQTSQAQIFADTGKFGSNITRDYLLRQAQEGLIGSIYDPSFKYNKQKGRNRYNTEYTGNI